MLIAKSAAALLGIGLLVPLGLVDPAPDRDPDPAHCQIPCGIYDDAARFTELNEHITTIEKSMQQIAELQQAPGENANQLIRWVMNKEDHADEFARILSEYFLQQRLALAEAESDPAAYQAKLAAVHGLLVHAMKAKQTIDTAHVAALRTGVHDFRHLYHGEAHEHE